MICKANAKINLSLKILGTREDGYHLLEMVNLPVELHDIISVEPFVGQHSFITCDDLRLRDVKHNLCNKALEEMRKEFGFKKEFLIDIHKEIPFAAGLGGGSSNAATVVKAINALLHLKADPAVLNQVGSRIGADVPFFLTNMPAKVSGIGEIMEPIPVKKHYFCLIVKPEEGLSTKDVYAICDQFPKQEINTQGVIDGLANDDLDLVARSMGNDLMAPAISLLPVVGEIVDDMKKLGFPVSMMSGSGSSCFALSKDQKKLREAYHYFEKKGYIVNLTKVIC